MSGLLEDLPVSFRPTAGDGTGVELGWPVTVDIANLLPGY